MIKWHFLYATCVTLNNFLSSFTHSYIFSLSFQPHVRIYREHLILFNPVISPQTKEFSIRRMIATGLLSQFLGNVLTFASHNEAWIFNGLIKFLQYFITSNSSDDASQKIFINEILHPTLHYRHQQLFAFHSMEDERGNFLLFISMPKTYAM